MTFKTFFDDDPDHGLPGFRTYAVLNVTGPGAISLIGDAYVQKAHPRDLGREINADIGERMDVVRAHIRRRV